MATNVTLIKNTLVNKYFVYHGGSVAVHEFPTQIASEFLIKLMLSKPGKYTVIAWDLQWVTE